MLVNGKLCPEPAFILIPTQLPIFYRMGYPMNSHIKHLLQDPTDLALDLVLQVPQQY